METAPASIKRISVTENASLREALNAMTYSGGEMHPTGIALVTKQDVLKGIITDGDIRRALLDKKTLDTPVKDVMTTNPITFSDAMSSSQILEQVTDRVRALQASGKMRNGRLEHIILVDASNRVTNVLSFFELWKRSEIKTQKICVVGLGYVGLTLAAVLADSGFQVVGIDTDKNIVASVNKGVPHFHEVGLQNILTHRAGTNLKAALPSDFTDDADIYIISVGTPVDEHNKPVLTYLTDTAEWVGKRLNHKNLVVLRSTVPVGLTKKTIIPLLERHSGLSAATDFNVAFAPERTIEGKALEELRSLPQIIGGYTNEAVVHASVLFRKLTPSIVTVNSLEEAEMVKLINNVFRDVSFGFANEIALLCNAYNVNAFDVIAAANNGYPRNPVPLPSPGVGGTCLRKDPYILRSVCEDVNFAPALLTNSREANDRMQPYIHQQVLSFLQRNNIPLAKAKIFVLGVAFKGYPETSDMRNSTAVDIIKLFGKEPTIACFDFVVSKEQMEREGLQYATLEEGFGQADVILILNNHPDIRNMNVYSLLETTKRPTLFFDGWNFFSAKEFSSIEGVHYATLGYDSSRSE